MDRTIFEFLIGGVFVVVYSYSRFSSNKMEDHLEVKTRYLSALLCYIVVCIVLYVALSFVISFGIALPYLGIDKILNDLKKAFPGEEQKVSAQLVAALFLTEGLPRIKIAASADNKLRYLFQRMASLSSTAQNLSSKFQNEPLEIQDRKEKIKGLEESFEKQGLDKRDIQIEDINERIRKPEHIWTRISLLWISINEWENQPEYKNFFKNHSNQFKSMKDEFGSLAEKVSHCFALVEAVEKTPDLKSALQDCADHYTIRLKKHLEKVSDFISCTLLNVKKGDARLDAIRQIGFKPSYNEGLSIDLLALLFIMLFFVFIVVFGVFYPDSSQAVRPMAAFVKAIMIPGMLTFSIAFATLAKKSCDRKGKTQHAYATYSFWAAVSVAIGSIISILMNTIVNNWNLNSGFDAFAGRGLFVDDPRAPWQLLVFAATFLIAYQLNHQKDDRIDHLKLRAKEAISMSLVLCIAFLIAGRLMSFTSKEFFSRGIVVIIIGLVIGYFIPTSYRGVPKRKKELIVTETRTELST